MKIFRYSLLITMGFLFSCTDNATEPAGTTAFSNNATTQFSKINSETSKVTFRNTIVETNDFNFLNYPYIYAGAGVAVGDYNNDGLEDIYFTCNFGPNKLYQNNGDFQFKDITKASKTDDYTGYSTGATALDINNDGWLDIYVSKAGSLSSDEGRRNLLFVNQKDGTFKEKAKAWGIDDPGYTTQAYSLDYDKDGDLDLYVVNYRPDFKNNAKISGTIQNNIEETTSDQLYRNDGSHFTKVTAEAGLYNKAWGLAGTVGDFNNDGWDDIYISNDYLEPDVMYINMKDGTFNNQINSRIKHISFNSMGADYADLDNDLFPDLITVDMLAENYARSKENMASMSTENFMSMVKIGYHHAYMANMLHHNTGNGYYSEISQLSGIVKTDWSWAPLIADFDNDGLKDIYITNGVARDYTNQDFRKSLKEKNARGESMTLEAAINMMPSQKLSNYLYRNQGDLTFDNAVKEWGLDDPSFSNGAAYADFDNDGDLDIVVNNANDLSSLYRNNAKNNFVRIDLEGPEKNKLGVGASVFVTNKNGIQLQKKYLARGYQSSVSKILNFGLGDAKENLEVNVVWPDGKTTTIKDASPNDLITLKYSDATNEPFIAKQSKRLKRGISLKSLGIDYTHVENDYNDYNDQLLLPQKQSTKGTAIITADVNKDGLDDFFVGNAKGAAAAMYIQNSDGSFRKTNNSLWQSEAKYEDANALFFDADGDNDQDLYVVSAGYELGENNSLLQDRLFINDGNGTFRKSNNALPKMLSSGKAITAGDYDNDGDLDLFIGGNVIPGKYPMAPISFLLKNEGGKFIDATAENLDLAASGMISDAIFTDYDNDQDLDIMVVGEWMKPTIFTNNNGGFSKTKIEGLADTEGWWYGITAADFDGDGDQDYILGNVGKNNKFQPKKDKPIYIYGKDFDDNGSFDVALSKLNEGKLVPVRGKECSSEQNPFLLEKIESYKEFASLDMNAIYGEEKLNDAFQLTAHTFESAYVENLGDGKFKLTALPNQAQTGPTLSIIAKDFNKDGHLDVMGIGSMYDAEVETIRYDSNFGYVLLGDGKGDFEYNSSYDPFVIKDSKDVTELSINGISYYAVVSNNAELELFSLEP